MFHDTRRGPHEMPSRRMRPAGHHLPIPGLTQKNNNHLSHHPL